MKAVVRENASTAFFVIFNLDALDRSLSGRSYGIIRASLPVLYV